MIGKAGAPTFDQAWEIKHCADLQKPMLKIIRFNFFCHNLRKRSAVPRIPVKTRPPEPSIWRKVSNQQRVPVESSNCGPKSAMQKELPLALREEKTTDSRPARWIKRRAGHLTTSNY